MPYKPISSLVLETLLWLPVTFFIWYKSAIILTFPVTFLLEHCLLGCWHQWIVAVKQHGYLIEVTTSVQLGTNLIAGQTALFAFDLNSLLYGYGLPFFAALTLAAPNSLVGKIGQILMTGVLVLLPAQVFSLVMTTLKVLIFQTTPEVMAQLAAGVWMQSLVGLGYQFGSLVFPSMLPLLAWLFFNQAYVKNLGDREGHA